MRIRENVFEHLTLCLAYGRNTVNGNIKISAVVERKWGWSWIDLVSNPSVSSFSLGKLNIQCFSFLICITVK